MPDTQSIKQKHAPNALPDFRSLGFVFRTLLLVNGLGLLDAVVHGTGWRDVVQQLATGLASLQPVLLANLLVLFLLYPVLARINYRMGVAAVLGSVALATVVIIQVGGDLYTKSGFGAWRDVALAVVGAGLLLMYFRVRSHRLYPALHQARLQALQARIRPHFLYNCINTVLSIIRTDPKRAETALEDMSDLFRMAMKQVHQLVPLQEELEVSRRYLELERLRLGERLKINWHLDHLPEDAMVPPLMLQPLLENAVYHGIEPSAEGGAIDIRLSCHSNELEIEIYNPCRKQGSHHVGNKLALENIRERLALQFDIEANYAVERGADYYRVQIVMPYVKQQRI